jgi:phage baseplate assembly protein W
VAKTGVMMSQEHDEKQYRSFLGAGWRFPPRFQKNGDILMTHDEQDIEASLKILLGTTPGERIMFPKYGLNMQELLFESLSTTAKNLLKERIETTLLIYESRINVLNIEIDESQLPEGRLVLSIDYEIRATNSRFNLVYPFYLNDGSEVSPTPWTE